MSKLSGHDPILTKEPLLKRMFDTNDYIVRGTGNYYWANSNHPGCLIEGLSSEENSDLFRLYDQGFIIKNTKTCSYNI